MGESGWMENLVGEAGLEKLIRETGWRNWLKKLIRETGWRSWFRKLVGATGHRNWLEKIWQLLEIEHGLLLSRQVH